jgi:DNA-directed RNA polymerase specialized sigma subunit
MSMMPVTRCVTETVPALSLSLALAERQRAIEDCRPLVPLTVRRLFGGPDGKVTIPAPLKAAVIEEGDLIGIGNLALVEAARDWRQERGAAFPSFAIGRIRYALKDLVHWMKARP